MRPRDPEDEEIPAAGEEMQVDRGREPPDPEELRRRAAEASADAAGARPTKTGGAGPASGMAVAMTPTVKNQQRDVSESLGRQ